MTTHDGPGGEDHPPVAELARRLAEVEAVLAIERLKARYAALVDQRFVRGRALPEPELARLAEQIALLFTEEARWDGGPVLGTAVGRVAIAERLARPTLTFARHLFVQPEITVRGDRARGRWQLLCPCTTTSGTDTLVCGAEDDEYVCVDGVWRHSSMQLTTVFVAPTSDGWGRILH